MFSNFLDLNTLSFVLVLVTTLLSFVLIFIWRIHKIYPGFKFWAISNLMVAAGFCLLGFRGAVPLFLTAIIGNTLTCGSVLTAAEGNRRFVGLPDTKWFSFSLLAILIGGLSYFSLAQNIVAARIIFMAGFLIILSARNAFLFIRHSPPDANVLYRSIGATYVVFGLIMFARAMLMIYFYDLNDLYVPDWFQATVLLIFVGFAVIWTFGYVILNDERLQQELKAAQVELQRLATTDFLTGINNNRNFFEIAANEIERARRFKHPLSVVMFDIDYFKQINDTYGHAAGDKILVEIAAVCKKTLRNVDVLGRLGGEEFAFLLPHTPVKGGQTAAECVRAIIEETEFEAGGQIIKVTASFGVDGLSGTDTCIKQVLDRADSCLYAAKRGGRNQTVCAVSAAGYRKFAAV